MYLPNNEAAPADIVPNLSILRHICPMELARKVISDELELFEKHFRDAVRSRVSLLDRIMRFIVKRKGKQLRPMFVLLCARLGGQVNDSSYRAASLVELLHTASLVHDDVIDDSLERRGFFSLNALWKNKIAVLVGDYLLMKALLLALNNKEYVILETLADAVKVMSEGELLQFEKSRKLNFSEEVYFEIIRGKTAALLSSACAAGASSTFGTSPEVEKLKIFGEKVGMAFQIKDDLFDYGNGGIGKPTGNDIKEKKLTLPLIYTLQHCSPEIKKQIIYIVHNQNDKKEKVRWVIDRVTETGGIDYATQKMMAYRDEALQVLHEFPESDCRNALDELVRYTTDRTY
ncbi:MAG: polyprenyl synthetase family protein [Sediminibacterium sp.]|nr:polyprenyl synthetase family protein [Sediminibacterium sp.]